MYFPEHAGIPRFDLVKDSYESLRAQEPLFYADVHSWLGNNLNHICDLLLGAPGCKIRGAGQYKSALKTLEGGTFLRVEATWPHIAMGGPPMALMKIKDRFPGITFERATIRSTARTFKAKLSLDLEEWPTLAMSMLWANAKEAFTDLTTPESVRAYREQQVCILIDSIYPFVKLHDIQIAANLGMLEDWEVFASWFKDRLTKRTALSMAIPDDLAQA